MKIYSGSNPGQMYLDALVDVMKHGDKLAPRGKKILEVRPAVFEYENPTNRTVFLKGRRMNPFFLMAEALWILAGRADVEWLLHYNRNMAQFSDDGVYFNAPYGERLRNWNVNSASGFIFNPIDQLEDVYKKIKNDIETRQAVALIYNPEFDNVNYGGKDTPCNNTLFFKVRNGKLDMTVCNRSNDLHYGVFTNLCQFSTIQETMAAWLGLEVGRYYQITDSLHVYLEDYGARETDKILDAYNIIIDDKTQCPEVERFEFEDEPRITLGFDEFNLFLSQYFNNLDPLIHVDDNIINHEIAKTLVDAADSAPDDYFRNTLLAMLAYRGHRLGNFELVLDAMDRMTDSQWKLSCLYFLFDTYGDKEEFRDLYSHYSDDKKRYIEERA